METNPAVCGKDCASCPYEIPEDLRMAAVCSEKKETACSSCPSYPCDTIRECALTGQATAYVHELFNGNAGGHDVQHTLRVYRNAMQIAAQEPGCDRLTVMLAALLHDADDHKLFATKNNENARRFLADQVSLEQMEEICACINSVSFSQNKGRKPASLEGMIVQDADRLDAMGAIGIARAFAFGGEHGRPLHETVRHFDEKLLLLRDLMNTEPAKRIAAERHAFMEAFLEQLKKETGSSGSI